MSQIPNINWQALIPWLEWPSTHQCTIQKIPFWDFMDAMKLSPRGQCSWSVFFFSGNCVFIKNNLAHPWPRVFLEAPTPFFLPTHLPLSSSCWPPSHPPPFALTSIARASDLGRVWVSQSFRSAKSTRASRAGSFRSALARGASTWW